MFQICYHNLCQQLPTAFPAVNLAVFNKRAFPAMIQQSQLHSADLLAQTQATTARQTAWLSSTVPRHI